MGKSPSYAANGAKALEAMLFVHPLLDVPDVYRMVKALYFADVFHINQHGRPITGDDYRAAPYGPLANVAYGILTAQPIELAALGHNGPLPVRLHGTSVRVDRSANTQLLSQSDREALSAGAVHINGKTFEEIYEETHQHQAYLEANGGRMDYRLFLSEDAPNREAKEIYISESAPYAVL